MSFLKSSELEKQEVKNKYLCSPQLVPGKHEAWDVNSYLFHTSKHISSFLWIFAYRDFIVTFSSLFILFRIRRRLERGRDFHVHR